MASMAMTGSVALVCGRSKMDGFDSSSRILSSVPVPGTTSVCRGCHSTAVFVKSCGQTRRVLRVTSSRRRWVIFRCWFEGQWERSFLKLFILCSLLLQMSQISLIFWRFIVDKCTLACASKGPNHANLGRNFGRMFTLVIVDLICWFDLAYKWRKRNTFKERNWNCLSCQLFSTCLNWIFFLSKPLRDT